MYIDDVIWVAPNTKTIHKVLESLQDELEITIEGDATAFLGIQFDHLPNGEIQLQQQGLINRVLNTTGMQTCNPDRTPASQQPLGTDKDGLEFSKSWSSSVVGMLLYLAAVTLILKSPTPFINVLSLPIIPRHLMAML